MPNYCDVHMMITGRKDKVDELYNIINADYDYHKMEFSHDKHFYRIFDNEVYSYQQLYGMVWLMELRLECAWSGHTCMRRGPHTYYNDNKDDPKFYRGTCLEIEAARLGVRVEFHSIEPGCAFSEHFRISPNGVTQVDECYDYYEFSYEWTDGDYDTYLEMYRDWLGPKLTKEEFEEKYKECDNHIITSCDADFDDYDTSNIIYMVNNVIKYNKPNK